MIRINLLPHREVKRRAKQIQFYALSIVSVLLALVILGIVHVTISSKIDYQERRNTYLKQEILQLDRQISEIKKLRDQTKSLLERKDAVEKLQSDRSRVVHLLDQMLRILPDGVYIKSLKQTGDVVTLVGYAQSNARVSTLMRSINDSPWLDGSVLVESHATTAAGARVNEFTLTYNLTKLQDVATAQPGAKNQVP
jgi:type IV pilus assembly protein PilN